MFLPRSTCLLWFLQNSGSNGASSGMQTCFYPRHMQARLHIRHVFIDACNMNKRIKSPYILQFFCWSKQKSPGGKCLRVPRINGNKIIQSWSAAALNHILFFFCVFFSAVIPVWVAVLAKSACRVAVTSSFDSRTGPLSHVICLSLPLCVCATKKKKRKKKIKRTAKKKASRLHELIWTSTSAAQAVTEMMNARYCKSGVFNLF